jgi:hypothetical protein
MPAYEKQRRTRANDEPQAEAVGFGVNRVPNRLLPRNAKHAEAPLFVP